MADKKRAPAPKDDRAEYLNRGEAAMDRLMTLHEPGPGDPNVWVFGQDGEKITTPELAALQNERMTASTTGLPPESQAMVRKALGYPRVEVQQGPIEVQSVGLPTDDAHAMLAYQASLQSAPAAVTTADDNDEDSALKRAFAALLKR